MGGAEGRRGLFGKRVLPPGKPPRRTRTGGPHALAPLHRARADVGCSSPLAADRFRVAGRRQPGRPGELAPAVRHSAGGSACDHTGTGD